jgi:hypothetical protein
MLTLSTKKEKEPKKKEAVATILLLLSILSVKAAGVCFRKRSRSFHQMIRCFKDTINPNAVLCL